MSSDVEIFRRLRALEREVARQGTLEYRARRGLWTPAFAGDGGTPGTFTYATQSGSYVYISGLVVARFDIRITAISVAPTGNMAITGLPFTADGRGDALFSFVSNFNFSTGALWLTGRIGTGGVVIALSEVFDNTSSIDVGGAGFINANCNLIGRAIYDAA